MIQTSTHIRDYDKRDLLTRKRTTETNGQIHRRKRDKSAIEITPSTWIAIEIGRRATVTRNREIPIKLIVSGESFEGKLRRSGRKW